MFFDKTDSIPAGAVAPLVFSIFVILALVLGCFFGGKQCTGELTVEGKRYSGIDQNEADARRNTCAKYCIEGDPEMDAMYRVWLDSLSEKERKRVRKGGKGKWDAVYESERIRKYVESCEQSCLGKSEKQIAVVCK